MTVRAYRDGDLLKLERNVQGDSLVLAARLSWGASLIELSLNGTNYVNAYDPGREVQVAAYDGKQTYDNVAGRTGVWGWNPVQAGDRHGHGSPVSTWRAAGRELYARIQPIEWYPDNKGGGAAGAVATDVEFEQRITPVSHEPRAFRLRYRVIHCGQDAHGLGDQELPAIYTNQAYSRLAVSGSGPPWSGQPPVYQNLPALGQPTPFYPTQERWAALVDANGDGLMVFVPWAYPFVSGFTAAGNPALPGSATSYFHFLQRRAIAPGESFDFDVYLIAGPLADSRAIAGRLAAHFRPRRDPLPPMGALDSPLDHDAVTGSVTIHGWAFDNIGVARVRAYLDSQPLGRLLYGQYLRPDVDQAWPGMGQQVGFAGTLPLHGAAPGAHQLRVEVIDRSGNRLSLGPRIIQVT